ncbi:hypothetical protein, partial [Streptomyces sp. NPDC056405]|uniref:hypothetical protein n=1 Tax=Streptomyces sp. NPDC056405 TaxID=3345811 RepID=UPI0035D54CC4
MKKASWSYPRVRVGSGGRGVVARAGSVLLVETVRKSGLESAISAWGGGGGRGPAGQKKGRK